MKTTPPSIALRLVSLLGLLSLVSWSQTKEKKADSPWPCFRGSPAQMGIAPGELADALELGWTFKTEQAVISSPVIDKDTVYVGSDDGKVYAIDWKTGKQRWAFATEDIIEAPPLIYEDRVYIGSSDFFFYAIDARSGELLWKFETEDKILGGASWFRHEEENKVSILVGSYDGCLYCFDAQTGEVSWKYQTDNFVNGTPALDGHTVLFGGCDSILHMVDARDGQSLGNLEIGEGCHIAGSAGIREGRAYFGHYGNEFICVDIASREKIWSYQGRNQPFFSSPAIGEKFLVFGGRDKQMHCVDRLTGEKIWSVPHRKKIDSSAVICGDKVVYGTGEGSMHLLRLEDGESLWTYEIGKPILSSPAVAEGWVVIGCNDGNVYAFRAAEDSAK